MDDGSMTGLLRERLPGQLADRLIVARHARTPWGKAGRHIEVFFRSPDASHSRWYRIEVPVMDWLTDATITRICLEAP
jgi:hypothetical protein